MNKKILWGVGIVIIVAAAFLYISQRKDKGSDYSSPDVSKIMGSESMRELMAKGKPLQCDINQNEVKSTFYFSENNFRTNFVSVTEAKENIGHMILKGDTSYTWMDGETKGFKMTVNPELKADAQANAQNNEKVDLDAKVDYECSSWKKDDSYFELPPNVEFTDLSAMMNTKVEATGGTDLKAIQCAACNSAPEESRAECKKALNCE